MEFNIYTILLIFVIIALVLININWKELTSSTDESSSHTETVKPVLNKKYSMWIIPTLIAVLLAISNPNKEQHQNCIMREISKDNPIDLSDDSSWGYALGMSLATRFLDNVMEVHNYGLFSLGELHFEGKSRMVTIGALGNVFYIADKDVSISDY